MSTILKLGENAKVASRSLSKADSNARNNALNLAAESLLKNSAYIIKENARDIENGKANGLSDALIDRLMLDETRINGMANGLKQIAMQEDPIGKIDGGTTLANNMKIIKIRVPIGVIGIIYESRPNVTSDAAGLCLKTGNAVILRGGKEAINSNLALVKILREALKSAGLDENCVQLVEDTSRESATELMRLQALDLLIPRGGIGLIKTVVENAKVPVIETGAGNCHVYVDKYANFEMALKIIENAKVQRPSVCNAAETLLVHKDIASDILPKIKSTLDKSNVELRGCAKTCEILTDIKIASESDFETEFNDYVLAIKVVDDASVAINHINKYGTMHSECIVTDNLANSEIFLAGADAAAVYVNASTRFTDGEVFGLGAEIGISTQKTHARGPMGAEALTSTKYQIIGNGQIR